jgi:hypothetical protein
MLLNPKFMSWKTELRSQNDLMQQGTWNAAYKKHEKKRLTTVVLVMQTELQFQHCTAIPNAFMLIYPASCFPVHLLIFPSIKFAFFTSKDMEWIK